MNKDAITQIKLRCYELAKESLAPYGTIVSVDKILEEAKKIEKYLFSDMIL